MQKIRQIAMMGIDAVKLAERVSELTKAYQKQQEKFGKPGYDPLLLRLLHQDLTELKAQLNDPAAIEEIA